MARTEVIQITCDNPERCASFIDASIKIGTEAARNAAAERGWFMEKDGHALCPKHRGRD